MSNVAWASCAVSPRLGSGYRPSQWCPDCHGTYPSGGTCTCKAQILAHTLRAQTRLLLQELYGSASGRRCLLCDDLVHIGRLCCVCRDVIR